MIVNWTEMMKENAQMVITDWGCEETEEELGCSATIYFNTAYIPDQNPRLERYKETFIFFATTEEVEKLKKEYTWYDEVNNDWDLVER